jgi:hypothetical protein
MKRWSILVVLLMSGALASNAQWTTTTPLLTPNVFTGGKIGIGTSTPAALLDVYTNLPSQATYLTQQWTTSDPSYNLRLVTVRDANGITQRLVQKSNGVDYTSLSFFNGNVGIGTAIPRGKFDVDGPGDIYLTDDVNAGTAQSIYLPGHIYIAPYNGTNWTYLQARRSNDSGSTNLMLRTSNAGSVIDAMSILSNGNIGIGNGAPNEKLSVIGNIHIPLQSSIGFLSSQDKFNYDNKIVGNYSLGWCNDSWFAGAPSGYLSAFGGLKIFTNSTMQFAVTYNGNVGIGTATPDAKLAVKGTIHAQEVRVDLSVPGPDYVFEEIYNLPSLADTETYIKQNKHLPEVPSACEMEENGINLSEMNMILLKKVEELTLYVIELKKEVDSMNLQKNPNR